MNNNQNVNLLQNVPQIEGIDQVLVGDLIARLYADYSYRAFVTNYWVLSQGSTTQAQEELIPEQIRRLFAQEAIKSALIIAQTVGSFDWSSYASNLNMSGATQGAQTARRAG